LFEVSSMVGDCVCKTLANAAVHFCGDYGKACFLSVSRSLPFFLLFVLIRSARFLKAVFEIFSLTMGCIDGAFPPS